MSIILPQNNISYRYSPIRMAKIKTVKHQVLVRMWSSRNSLSLLVGMQNGTATVEDNLAISYKIRHTLTITFNSHTLWYPNELKNVCPLKKLHKDVYSSFIHNCQT